MGSFNLLAISAIEYLPVSWRSWAVNANCSFSGDKPDGRPPFLPLAFAASSPALVRSRMISCSNSANEAKILKVNLPVAVVVSMWSCKLTKFTSCSWKSATKSTKSLSDRPSLSSFQTTTWSPFLRFPRSFLSSGLSVFFPETFSW